MTKTRSRLPSRIGVGTVSRPSRATAKRKFPPPLRTAFIFIIPFIIIHFLIAIFPEAWYFYMASALILVFSGYVGAGLYSETIFHKHHNRIKSESIKNGVASGLVVSIVGWILFALLFLILSAIGVMQMVAYDTGVAVLIALPLEVLSAVLLSAFGAWVHYISNSAR